MGRRDADLVAFGRPFIANPDFVERLRRGAPFNQIDPALANADDHRGYIDYPGWIRRRLDATNPSFQKMPSSWGQTCGWFAPASLAERAASQLGLHLPRKSVTLRPKRTGLPHQ